MKIDIEKILLTRTDDQLIKDNYLGEESYQEGIYELYLNEAKRRGIEINIDEIKISCEKNVELSNIQKINKNVLVAIILSFIGFGLFSFIPAFGIISLINKEKVQDSKKYTILSMLFITWSFVAWSGIIAIIIIFKILSR